MVLSPWNLADQSDSGKLYVLDIMLMTHILFVFSTEDFRRERMYRGRNP